MPNRKPHQSFKRMPKGQQKAHVSQAASAALRAVQGDLSKLTVQQVNAAAAKLDVPVGQVMEVLKKKHGLRL